MLKNYLKISLRNLRRYKGHSILNITGLAIGMACCILIFLYVQDELSFDRYHEKAGRIYRLTYAEVVGGARDQYAMSPFAAAPAFASDLPEIRAYSRILFRSGLFTYGDKKFDERGITLADSSFFEIFTYAFIHGNAATALRDPASIVLTAESAEKIFGQKNPIGETLNLNGAGDLKVTGVIRNIPRNSHFTFNYILPMGSFQRRRPELMSTWLNIFGWTYILLDESADPGVVESKFDEIVQIHTGEEAARSGIEMTYELQKLTDIHLKSHLRAEIEGNGDINNVYIFSMIAVFILGIACINFMNLSTARSANRSREVGLRKVLGAHKNRLVYQFLSESVLMSLLGLFVAAFIVELTLPAFNNMAGKEISVNYLKNWTFTAGLAGLALFTGIVAGSYPAFFLAAFNPVTTLKGKPGERANRSTFRNVLVVLQFTISIALIASTMLVLNQMYYMKNKKLGFDKEQIVTVRLRGQTIRQKAETYKNELLRHPGILSATLADGLPGRTGNVLTVNQEGKDEKHTHTFVVIFADFDFAKTFGIKISQGRDFSRAFIADTAAGGAFLINQTAANKLGWGQDAVGKKIGFSVENMGTIVGIVDDFHYKSLKEAIGPLAINLTTEAEHLLSLKIRTENISQTLSFIEDKWHEFGTDREFGYFFVDENFASLYRSDERLSKIVFFFSTISILVACLGLFGLASFSAEQRTKEIGVRKVLGASVPGIIALLSRDFTKWVLMANILAWPVAWYAMNRWLQNFAYRIDIGWWVFVLAGGLALVIALMTVSTQAVKAALANPVDSLRYE